jgi:hypothetical protein
MTAETAAAYLDFSTCKDPVGAFRRWAKHAGLVRAHRGDVPLNARADLDRAINASPRRRSERCVKEETA